MKNQRPLVSIIIPYYDAPDFFRETLQSLNEQTYDNFEIVVVDDASPDPPALEIVDEFTLLRIKVIRHAINTGPQAARNTGVANSSGSYILPLDCDDKLTAGFLEETVRALEDDTIDGAFTQIFFFGEEQEVWIPEPSILGVMSGSNSGPNTLLYRREVYDAVGGYNARVYCSDASFWLAALDKGFKFARIDKPLLHYRVRSQGRLSRLKKQEHVPNLAAEYPEIFAKNMVELLRFQEERYFTLLEGYRWLDAKYKSLLAERSPVTGLQSRTDESVSVDVSQVEKGDGSDVQKYAAQDVLKLLFYSEFRARSIAKRFARLASSLSWRITEPIRKAKQTLRNMSVPSESISRELKLIADSGLFDEDYYNEQCRLSGLAIASNPVAHFAQTGWRLGLNPNGFFDTAFYLGQLKSSDWLSTSNPLTHFLLEGVNMGLPTSQFFDSGWYMHTYPDVKESGINPLLHFLRFGMLEGRLPINIPSPMSLKDHITAELNKLSHFQTRWRRTGHFPDCPYDLVLAVHEASRTGAPMLGLALLRQFVAMNYHCLLILKKGGELAEEFGGCADTMVIPDFGNPALILDRELDLLIKVEKIKPETTVFLNSAELHALNTTFAKHGLRVVTLIHEFLSNYEKPIRDRLIESSDITVFSSVATREDFLKTGSRQFRHYVIPQGLIAPDFGRFADRDKERDRLCTMLDIPIDSFIVLACGSADQRKGIDIFVQVAVQTITDAARSDIYFLWIGDKNSDGDTHALRWAQEDAKHSGIGAQVHFVPSQKDVEKFFVAADVFLLSSRQDPLPCVLHLAMASGLPVIAFQNSGGADEVLADGGGKLVSYGSINAMSGALLEYYHNADLRRVDGSVGRKIVSSRFKMEEYASELLTLAGLARGEPDAVHHGESRPSPRMDKFPMMGVGAPHRSLLQ